ncbi:alkaline phosphatase family protein [bacterium]|nr:alkaline phosphatase family protein [candidate division CSSED10-310 bacterium]
MDSRGIVFIQWDAMCHREFRWALKNDLLPGIAECFDDGMNLLKTYNPLPTNTLNFQVRFMYSPDSIIPGSRWLDRATGKVFSITRFSDVRKLEMRLSDSNDSLLTQDQVFGTLLKGKTLQGIPARPKSHALGLAFRFAGDVIRHPASSLHFKRIYLSFMEQLSKQNLRTIETLLVHAQKPLFYINFMAYDQTSHFRGLRHRQTMDVLKTIDRQIQRLIRLCNNTGYNPVLFSDHGMAPSIPFHKAFGITFTAFINQRFSDLKIKPIILPSGNMAHVYCDASVKNDIDKLEGVANDIGSHAGIDRVILPRHPDGIRVIQQHDSNTLNEYHWEENRLNQMIQKLASHPDSGDLIVFGGIWNGQVINFMNQKACHNGWLLGQAESFVLSSYPIDPGKTDDTVSVLRAMAFSKSI